MVVCRARLHVFRPGLGEGGVGQPVGLGLVAGVFASGLGFVAKQRGQPALGLVDLAELVAGLRQTKFEARVKERDGGVALIAGLVRGERVRCETNRRALGAVGLEHREVAGPSGVEAFVAVFLGAGVGHHRNLKGFGWQDDRRTVKSRLSVRLVLPVGVGRTGSEPDGDDALRMFRLQDAGPGAAAAVSPEAPGGLRQLRMTAGLPEVLERL